MSQAITYLNTAESKSKTPTSAINIVISNVLNKDTLLTSLAKACHFPHYFSHNWDSAYDCLTDGDIEHLQLNLTHINKIHTESLNAFREIVEDAFEAFGKPKLWIITSNEDK